MISKRHDYRTVTKPIAVSAHNANMELVQPSAEYKDSFIEAVKEFQADTEFPLQKGWYHERSISELEADFSSFVDKQLGQSRGEGLPAGYVPQTNYWLVDGKEFIGGIRIRHSLATEHLKQIGGHIGYIIRPSKRGRGHGKKTLELALPKVKELGISRVLLTCDATNEPSRKIIEKNGGVFNSAVPNPETGVDKRRYWIDIS